MNNQTKKITTLTKRVNNLSKRINQTAPVAVNRISGSNAQRNVKSLSLKQTERLGTVLASGVPGFALASYNINPGTMFPWLSQHARLYDKYRFRSLKFTFKTAVPTNTPGNVGIGVDYDVLDSEPTNAIEFSQLASWSAQSVWKNFSTTVDVKKPLWDYLYNRSYLVGGADLKTYDIGKLLVYTEGLSLNAGDIVGYLEATYDVELVDKTPTNAGGILTASLTSAAKNNLYRTNSDGSATGSSISLQADAFAGLMTRGQNYLINNLSLQAGGFIGTPYSLAVGTALSTDRGISLDRGLYAVTFTIDNRTSALPTNLDFDLYSWRETDNGKTDITKISTANVDGFLSAMLIVSDASYIGIVAHNYTSSTVTVPVTLRVRDLIIRKL